MDCSATTALIYLRKIFLDDLEYPALFTQNFSYVKFGRLLPQDCLTGLPKKKSSLEPFPIA